jgi:hypothetical protein
MFKRLAISCAALLFSTIAALAQLSGGQVGQFITSTVLVGSAVTYTTTATPYTLTSVSLPAGHWACQGSVIDTAAGTTFPSAIAAFNTTAATLPTAPAGGYSQYTVSATTGVGGGETGVYMIDVTTAPTVVFLVIQAAFTGTAPTAYGQATCWVRG